MLRIFFTYILSVFFAYSMSLCIISIYPEAEHKRSRGGHGPKSFDFFLIYIIKIFEIFEIMNSILNFFKLFVVYEEMRIKLNIFYFIYKSC